MLGISRQQKFDHTLHLRNTSAGTYQDQIFVDGRLKEAVALRELNVYRNSQVKNFLDLH